MYLHYFYWQYIVAPLWLLRFGWTLQRMLLQMFSVRTMVVTLFAHWHKDRVAFTQGTFTGLLKAVAWNAISRAVGFCVRSCILILWAGSETVFLLLAAGTFIVFVVAPPLAAFGIAYGAALLLSGG